MGETPSLQEQDDPTEGSGPIVSAMLSSANQLQTNG